MSSLSPAETELERRKKALLWRCRRRGTQELDLLLGRFAAENLPGMDAALLERFEALVASEDPDLQRWLAGAEPLPERFGAILGRRVAEFSLVR